MGKEKDRRLSRPATEAVEPTVAEKPAVDQPVVVAPALDVEAKVKQIEASKLSDAEKKSYTAHVRGTVADPLDQHRVPFDVYANIKKIRSHVRKGMQQFPPAKGVKAATIHEWDAIFKDF